MSTTVTFKMSTLDHQILRAILLRDAAKIDGDDFDAVMKSVGYNDRSIAMPNFERILIERILYQLPP